jgi:hypothetical protein
MGLPSVGWSLDYVPNDITFWSTGEFKYYKERAISRKIIWLRSKGVKLSPSTEDFQDCKEHAICWKIIRLRSYGVVSSPSTAGFFLLCKINTEMPIWQRAFCWKMLDYVPKKWFPRHLLERFSTMSNEPSVWNVFGLPRSDACAIYQWFSVLYGASCLLQEHWTTIAPSTGEFLYCKESAICWKDIGLRSQGVRHYAPSW